MISARVYSRTGQLLLVTDPDQIDTAFFDRVYADWATIITTREVGTSASHAIAAIWENLISIQHRDGPKVRYC